jgi:hypothetical protein
VSGDELASQPSVEQDVEVEKAASHRGAEAKPADRVESNRLGGA